MKPNRGFVLVAPVETSETFDGGTIILPQSVREGVSQYQCTVLAIGLPEICEDRKCQRDHCSCEATGDSICAFCCIRSEGVRNSATVLYHRTYITAGDWVLVKPRCYIDASHPTETQYFVHINNVEAVFVQSTEAAAEVT